MEAETSISQYITQRISYQQQRINQLAILIPTLAQNVLSNQRHRIETIGNRLPIAIERQLITQKHLLESLSLKLQGFDPQLLLSRGYSITLHNGRAVRDPKQLKAGDEIVTRVEKGTVISRVER